MRRILIGVTIIGIGGIATYFYVNNTETYVAPEVITNIVTQEVEVDALAQTIEDAINASSTATEAKAQEAYDATVERIEKQIELDVRRELQVEAEKKIIELEKDVGTY